MGTTLTIEDIKKATETLRLNGYNDPIELPYSQWLQMKEAFDTAKLMSAKNAKVIKLYGVPVFVDEQG